MAEKIQRPIITELQVNRQILELSKEGHGHAYLTGKRRLDPEWAPGTAILPGTAVELTLCQKDITLATVCDALQTNKVLAQLAWNVP